MVYGDSLIILAAYYGKFDYFINNVHTYISEKYNIFEESILWRSIEHGCRYYIEFAKGMYNNFFNVLDKETKFTICARFLISGIIDNKLLTEAYPDTLLYPTIISRDTIIKLNRYDIPAVSMACAFMNFNMEHIHYEEAIKLYDSLYQNRSREGMSSFMVCCLGLYNQGYSEDYNIYNLDFNGFYPDYNIDSTESEDFIDDVNEMMLDKMVFKHFWSNDLPDFEYSEVYILSSTLDALYFYKQGLHIDKCRERFSSISINCFNNYQVHRPVYFELSCTRFHFNLLNILMYRDVDVDIPYIEYLDAANRCRRYDVHCMILKIGKEQNGFTSFYGKSTFEHIEVQYTDKFDYTVYIY